MGAENIEYYIGRGAEIIGGKEWKYRRSGLKKTEKCMGDVGWKIE